MHGEAERQTREQDREKKNRESRTQRLIRIGSAEHRKTVRRIGRGLLRGAVAFLLGQAELPFATFPLGVAFLCASSGSVLPSLAGLILSVFLTGEQPIPLIVTYVAAALIRAVSSRLGEARRTRQPLPEDIRQKLFSDAPEDKPAASDDPSSFRERFALRLRSTSAVKALVRVGRELKALLSGSLPLRMVTAAVGMLIVSLFRLIAGGFRYFDLFAALFAVVFAPLAVLLFSAFLRNRRSLRVLYALSAGVLLFSVVFSASPLALGGIPLGCAIALFLSLLVAHRGGVVPGSAAAVLTGLAQAPMEIPTYLSAVLVYLLFRSRKRSDAGVLAATLVALSWSVYAIGISTAVPRLIAFLVAGAVFSAVVRLRSRMAPEQAPREETPPADAEAQLRYVRARHEDSNDRLRGISDAFSSLSEMFYNLSDRQRRPSVLDLRQVCDTVFDKLCPSCPNRTVCWGLEYSGTLEAIGSLASALHTRGKVTEKHLPARLRKRCPSFGEILSEINAGCSRLTGDLLRDNRTEIFAMDYEAAANILNDALEEDDGEYQLDAGLASRIADYLSDVGISARSVTVYGNRRRQILVRGVDVDGATVTTDVLRTDLSEMCGLELTNPVFEVEGDVSTMLLRSRKRFAVNGAQNCLAADGGASGDTVSLFSNRRDCFYALINDGMGSGSGAAMTSGLCSVFLEKMLRAGNRSGTSLRMLNNLILSRTRSNSAAECSSTVDLAELDLVTGVVTFLKSGAAPGFIVRGTTVHRVRADSAPIGILQRIEAKVSTFPLKAGDTVVMISDGVQQNDPDCAWLTSYLSRSSDKDPEEIVYQICLHASASLPRDDCSAVALRISDEKTA